MSRYILVEWPKSQEFIGREGCYYCSPTEDGQLDQAMFVSEVEPFPDDTVKEAYKYAYALVEKLKKKEK